MASVSDPIPGRSGTLWKSVRTVVIGAFMLLIARVLYLVFLCPYTLVEDEAQYWVWSRHPDLSYYTKGPGVAWSILASTKLFGDGEWAVRLPTVIASSLGLVATALLAHDCFSDSRTTRRSAWCFVLAPAFFVAGLMMTIDGPYIACWAIACWCGWRALGKGDARYLPALGLSIGMGVLYKYTMLLVLPGLLVWALVWRGTGIRGRGARSHGVVWLVIGLLLLLASLLPIVLWNQQHGWTTLKHLFGHLGIEGGDVPATQGKDGWEYNPLWTLTLVGTQLGLVGPVLVLGAMGAIRAWRERANDRAAWHAASFLIAVAAPMYLFYLIVSFVAEPEGNWPLAGAVSLLPLAGRQAVRGWDDYRDRVLAWRALPVPRPWQGFFVRSPWTATSALWIAAVVVGIGLLVFGLRLDVVARLPGVSRVVPVGRFTGAQRMGAHAGRIVEELRSQSGQEPFVIAHHYGRASQLSYYMPGRPDVYCSSSVMPGGRVTPWDFWPELDLRRAVALGGRPALVVGLTHRHWEAVFERVEYVGALEGDHKLDKDGSPTRPAFRAYGFRGFPEGGVPEPDWGAAAEGGA